MYIYKWYLPFQLFFVSSNLIFSCVESQKNGLPFWCVFRPYPVALSIYSWLSTQGSFLAVTETTGDQTWISHVRGKPRTCCTIFLAPGLHYNSRLTRGVFDKRNLYFWESIPWILKPRLWNWATGKQFSSESYIVNLLGKYQQ